VKGHEQICERMLRKTNLANGKKFLRNEAKRKRGKK